MNRHQQKQVELFLSVNKRFVYFLKENKVYETFCRYLFAAKSGNAKWQKRHYDFLKRGSAFLVTTAIDGVATAEGWDFWSELNYAYVSRCREWR